MKYENTMLLPAERRSGTGSSEPANIQAHGAAFALVVESIDPGAVVRVEIVGRPWDKGPAATLELDRAGKASAAVVTPPAPMAARWAVEGGEAVFSVGCFYEPKEG